MVSPPVRNGLHLHRAVKLDLALYLCTYALHSTQHRTDPPPDPEFRGGTLALGSAVTLIMELSNYRRVFPNVRVPVS